MDLLIDADGHVLEPPDVWERYIEPRYRARAIRVRRGVDGRDVLEIDGRPRAADDARDARRLRRHGEDARRAGRGIAVWPLRRERAGGGHRPGGALALLDRDGITHALLYPSLGLQWEAEIDDPAYAAAHCQAYNRWIEEFCAGSGGRLVPIAHLSLGDPAVAAAELRRAVRNGARGAFVLPFTLSGMPHGHPAHDPLWAAAEELDVPIAIHTGVDPHGAWPASSLRRPHLAGGRAHRHLVPAADVPAGRAAGVRDLLPVRHLRSLSAARSWSCSSRAPAGSAAGWIAWTRCTTGRCGSR